MSNIGALQQKGLQSESVTRVRGAIKAGMNRSKDKTVECKEGKACALRNEFNLPYQQNRSLSVQPG